MSESLCELLEQFIPDDATCISVKINVPDYDPSDNNFVPPAFASVKQYLIDSGVEILACSSGLHVKGRKEVPHLHYHFITKHYNGVANPSGHRQRWLKKKGNEEHDFAGASFSYKSLESDKPKYQFLSYPLKEGHKLRSSYYLFDGSKMNTDMVSFLLDVGNTIYQTQLALRLRQEKCQERKQLAFSELVQLVGDRTFSSFRDLCDWFDDNYLYNLDYDDIPDPKNYKTNIRKIAIKKRLLKTFDI